MDIEELINHRLTEEEKIIILSLVAIDNITTLRIHKALKEVKNIVDIKYISKKEFSSYFEQKNDESYDKFHYNLTFDYKSYFDFYKIDLIFFDSEYYPRELFRLYDFPLVIFYRGNKDLLLFKRKMSIVGTRNNTKYSDNALDVIVPYLVKNNFVIVSGLASGVDGLSHIKTIKNNGYTIGVIAHGHNTIYPEENKYLYEIMEKTQLIISEYIPTAKIRKYRFLERNRIVASLGCALLITEAGIKSGTSRTIDYALDIGNTVMCLPGRFGDKMSLALNEHIKNGATIINKLEDIRDELKF